MSKVNKWYEIPGENSDIAVSSRIRLARNVSEYPFPSKMDINMKNEFNLKVKDAFFNGSSAFAGDFEYVDMASVSDLDAMALMEKHLVSAEFVSDRNGKALLLSKDRSVSIMLCEEDHIRIQVIKSGLNLNEAYEYADKIDTFLNEKLNFAFSEKLGFLTECPSNLGTGLRASVMLHLPMLHSFNKIDMLSNELGKTGMTLRGFYGEGSRSLGNMYQLSNQVTLGLAEREIIDHLSAILSSIIKSENKFRSVQIDRDKTDLEDTVFRSLGILKYARRLSMSEFSQHLSNLRLGVALKMIDDISFEQINIALNCFGKANLIRENNQNSNQNPDCLRADAVRKLFN